MGRPSWPVGTSSADDPSSRSTFVKKMAAESRKKPGRISLWSPSNVTRFLSPAYASRMSREWCGRTSASSWAVAKTAGMKQVAAWSMGRHL